MNIVVLRSRIDFSKFHIDHIVALKHGGSDDDNNLCLACYKCNAYKGSNVAALDPVTGNPTRLYNPRQNKWEQHFEINPDATLTGLTPEGRATILVLRINDDDRVKPRRFAKLIGEYPCTDG